MELHWDVLDKKRLDLLPHFVPWKKDGFYLARGTALALQLGHRTSLDFDFYTKKDFDPRLQRPTRPVVLSGSRARTPAAWCALSKGHLLGDGETVFPEGRPRPPAEPFMKAPPGVQACLWSYDVRALDKDRDAALIVTQVLNYGRWPDVRWLLQTYPRKAIFRVLRNPSRGSWLPDVLNFWTRLWKITLPKKRYHQALLTIHP